MRTLVIHIVLLMGLSLTSFAQSGDVDYDRYEPKDHLAPFGMKYWSNVGVMRMVNHSDNSQALRVCQPLIQQWLTSCGLVVRGPEELRPIQRRYRIRSAGQVSRRDAGRLRDRLNLQYLVIGSIDIFKGDSLGEVALSLRVLDLETMKIIRAASVAATSRDYGGLFGIGELNSIDELADRVVEKLFHRLDEAIKREKDKATFRIALVPIDNLSESRHAGAIMSNVMLSRLVRMGHDVVEPGIAYGLFVHHHVMPAGSISLATMDALRDEYGIDNLITGSVEIFKPGVLTAAAAQPKISLTGRILDAESGRIMGAAVTSTDGDGDALLDIGKEDSLGRLAGKAAEKLLKKLFKQQEQRVAAKK